jgi:hypothetical protein
MTRGQFRDIIVLDEHNVFDSGWRSNSIADDYGKFLAAQMRGDYNGRIKYLAIGGGGADGTPEERASSFKNKIIQFFKEGKKEPNGVVDWVWAKEIDSKNIDYIDENSNAVKENTNRLQVRVELKKDEPKAETALQLTEFGLLICPDNDDAIYLLNYVSHAPIGKTKDMTLDRTIELTFGK